MTRRSAAWAPRSLIAEIGTRFRRRAIAIIGEPTELKLGTRHKGCYSFTTTVTGKDGHSSQPERGLNAILAAAEVATELGRIYDRLRREGPFDKSFDPPHGTINLGRITGGTAVNIIARSCSIDWDFRGVPGTGPELVLKPLQTFVDGKSCCRASDHDRGSHRGNASRCRRTSADRRDRR